MLLRALLIETYLRASVLWGAPCMCSNGPKIESKVSFDMQNDPKEKAWNSDEKMEIFYISTNFGLILWPK